MNLLVKLKIDWQKYCYQRSLKRLRRYFAEFGFPIANFTDKEIEEGLLKASTELQRIRMTTDETGKAFLCFAEYLSGVRK
jgi:hypothetical protein